VDQYASCVDPRFLPELPAARLEAGVAPVCVACDARSLACDGVNQTYPKPNQGFWVDPGNPFNVMQCAEPSAKEACPAHGNVSDVLGGMCGIDVERRVYMGEACAFCADGLEGTLRSFRARGKCKKCPEVLWLPYLTGAMVRGAAQVECSSPTALESAWFLQPLSLSSEKNRFQSLLSTGSTCTATPRSSSSRAPRCAPPRRCKTVGGGCTG
jgi:hypothetical protein